MRQPRFSVCFKLFLLQCVLLGLSIFHLLLLLVFILILMGASKPNEYVCGAVFYTEKERDMIFRRTNQLDGC